MDDNRAAQLYIEDGDRGGSAYAITSDCILTVRHVLFALGQAFPLESLVVQFRLWGDLNQGDKEWKTASVLWSDPAYDVALLRISEQESSKSKTLGVMKRNNTRSILGRLPASGYFECETFGWPRVLRHGEMSSPLPFRGKTTGRGRTAQENIRVIATELTPKNEEGWKGMSGAAVWIQGTIVGLVVDADPNFKEGVLDVQPFSDFERESPFWNYLPECEIRELIDQPISSLFLTGDHGRVFIGEFIDIAECYIEPWQIFERVQLERYSPRPALEAAIESFLSQYDRGYLIFEASAGVGKTTLLAHEAKVRNAIHHFCELTPGKEGVLAAIRNLASQLILAWSLTKEIGLLIQTSSIGPDYLHNLLKRAATKRDASMPGNKIVIVIDSLELAGGIGDQNVLGLPKHLPKGVYIVVSQRPVDVNLVVTAPRRVIRIDPADPSNQNDLRDYLNGLADTGVLADILRVHHCRTSEFVDALTSKAGGVWVYAQFVLADVEGGRRSPQNVTELPPNLWRYYAEFFMTWQKHHQNDWASTGLLLLAGLAAFQKQVDLEDLRDVLGISDVALVQRILAEDWAAFVQRFGKEKKFRFYHASTQDFASGSIDESAEFTNQERLFADSISEAVVSAHSRIAKWYLEAWGGLEHGLPDLMKHMPDDKNLYGLKYVPFHLATGHNYVMLHELLNLSKGTSSTWYEAMLNQDDLNGYLSHLELASNATVNMIRSSVAPDAAAWALIVRYALIEASIGSLATNVPPCLVSALLTSKVWTLGRALTYAEHCEDGVPRARAYMSLLRHTEGKLHTACLESLISAIGNVNGIPQPFFQRQLWVELFADHSGTLAPDDLSRCITAFLSIDDSEQRLLVLTALTRLEFDAAIADQILDNVWNVEMPSGDHLDAFFGRYRIAVLQFRCSLCAIRHLPEAKKGPQLKILLALLARRRESGIWVAAATALAQDPGYPRIAATRKLMSLENVIGRSLELCREDKGMGQFAIRDLLPLLGSNKRAIFNECVTPLLLEDRGSETGRVLSAIAKANPDLSADLIKIARGHRNRPIAALAMVDLAPLIPAPAPLIDWILDSFSAMQEWPEVGDSISTLAPLLNERQASRAKTIIESLDDPSKVASGLANLAIYGRNSDETTVSDAFRQVEKLDDREKIQKSVSIFSASAHPAILVRALSISQRVHDETACFDATSFLLGNLPESERCEAVRFCLDLLEPLPLDLTRASFLARLSERSGKHLMGEVEELLISAILKIPQERFPEARVEALLARDRYSSNPGNSEFLRSVVECVHRLTPLIKLKLFGKIQSHASPSLLKQLQEESERDLGLMNLSDVRYALPDVAALLSESSLQKQIARLFTDTDKYYAWDHVCRILPIDAARKMAEIVADAEGSTTQIVPALAERLAELGDLDRALLLCEGEAGHRRLDGIIKIAPFLPLGMVPRALDLCVSAEIQAAFEAREETLGEIYVRQANLGAVDEALRSLEEIENTTIKARTELRIVALIEPEARAQVFRTALDALRSERNYRARSAICRILNALPDELVSQKQCAEFLIASFDASSRQRNECFFTMCDWAPQLGRSLPESVALGWYREVRHVHSLWP